MGRTVKLTIEFIREEFLKRGYILLENKFINNKEKMKYQCLSHPDKILNISWSSFQQGYGCKLCGYEKNRKPYLYNIGDIVEIKTGKIKILEQFVRYYKDLPQKYYKYECLICGYIGEKSQAVINNKNGCMACTGTNVCLGFNDIHSTNAYLESLILNKENAYKYAQGSHKSIDWVCEFCGNIIYNKKIYNVNKYGLSCNVCGNKGGSFPEKFLNNVLYELGLKTKAQKTFEWSQRKRYDCYLIDYNIILEIHGKQHSSICGFSSLGGRTLIEEQNNDELKYNLAIANHIDKYIVIDAYYPEFEYIKNSIINSELAILFDLSNIDWNKCCENSSQNIVKKSWELWNNGNNVKDISKLINIERTTIVRYLKTGYNIGKCTYDIEQQYKIGGLSMRKSCVCLETREIFESITIASTKYNISSATISNHLKERTKSAGRHPTLNIKLHWEYYDKEKHKDFTLAE